MRTAIAVAASLVLVAPAGQPRLSTVKLTNCLASSKSSHQLVFPTSTYLIDDGTAEDALGLKMGGDIISLNQFAVIPGSETITTVSIAWGTLVLPDPNLNGLPYTVAIWSDPTGDGNPTDAVLLTTAGGVLSSQGTNTFITTDIVDTTITTTNFFVDFLINRSAGQSPAAFNERQDHLLQPQLRGGRRLR